MATTFDWSWILSIESWVVANTVAFGSDYNVSVLSKFTNASTFVNPPVFGGVRVVYLSSFLCYVVVLCLFVLVLCLVCPVFLVSLDCPFLVVPSCFSHKE